jgi:hypothetical protein
MTEKYQSFQTNTLKPIYQLVRVFFGKPAFYRGVPPTNLFGFGPFCKSLKSHNCSQAYAQIYQLVPGYLPTCAEG